MNAGILARSPAFLFGLLVLAWPVPAFAASPWSPIHLGQIPVIALGAVIVFAIWTIVRTVVAIRRLGDDDSKDRGALRMAVRALLLVAGVFVFVIILVWRLGLPMAWPGFVLGAAWLALAHVSSSVARKHLPRMAAGIVSLVVADVAVGAVFWVARGYNYTPFVPTVIFFAAYVHITILAREEMLEKFGSPAAVALIGAIAILTPDPILSHASLRRLDVLDRPGIAMRVPGTQGHISSVFVDPVTGYIFYLDREDLTKIHSVSPDWGKRVFFQDRRERFERLVPGHKPGTMLATSSSPQGRSAFLMALPDMNVRANFAEESTEGGARQGPEAFYAVIDARHYISSARSSEGFALVRCQMPIDGSEPLSNMGANCARLTDTLGIPGPVVIDGRIGYVYALEPGSLFRRTSRIQLFNSSPAALLKALPLGYVATDIALTPSGRTLYVAATTQRKILYLNARRLEPTLEVDVDVFPTRILVDGAARFIYVGSYIDGQVQMLNIANGAVARPIPVGPGLNDLALDEKRQFLYAATDVGVVRVDLSLVDQPLNAVRLDSATGMRQVN
ncbi:MAG: hypothetical protein IT350_18035 [Deltaproteobacteria bacterium]|nr:hypothetical protein [Deltaproteobacteria bacterium]